MEVSTLSTKKKKALGKGLDALFPESPARTSSREGGDLLTIPVNSIEINPWQPRRVFDDERLAELSESISEKGVIQPLLVRRYDGGYQLVAGERRLRASRLAGLSEVPCLVVEADDETSLEIALIENLQRENLNPMEEARGYEELLSKFDLTQEQISQKVGKERSTVANSLRLLKLPPTIQEDLEVGRLSPGHARALLSLTERRLQTRLWSSIVEKGLSVRQAEALARNMKEKSNGGKSSKTAGEKKPPDIQHVEERLMAALGTRVRIQSTSKTSGKIIILYHNLEDMDRILEAVGVGEE